MAELFGINVGYLAIQIAVMGVFFATPLAVIGLAFLFMRRRQEAVQEK